MKCINLAVRTKDYEKYIYCKSKKKKIEFKECRNCKSKKYKQQRELKKKSNNLKKLEAKRFSILTDDLSICYICRQKKKDDLHEVFSGSNRRKSMIWGLVIPICRECHYEWQINKELRQKIQHISQRMFEQKHSHELFMEEFKKNYL